MFKQLVQVGLYEPRGLRVWNFGCTSRLGTLATLELGASVRSEEADHDRSNNQVTLELPLTLTDEEKNLELWRLHISFWPRGTNPPLTDGSRIYLGSRGDEEIRAYSTANGSEMWKHLSGVGIPSTAPVLHGDHVYYGTSDGYINAVSAQDGTLAWQHYVGATIADPLRQREDSIHFAAGNRYYSLNVNSRDLDWEYELKVDLSEDYLAVTTAAERIYLKVYGGYDADERRIKDTVLQAVDARSGRHLWNSTTSAVKEDGSYRHHLAAAKVVYVLGSNIWGSGGAVTEIHSIRTSDGSLNWTTEAEGEVYQMVADNGALYLITYDVGSSHIVSALDPSTGRVIWDFPIETNGWTSGPDVRPTIFDQTLYVGHTVETVVYAINTRTGALEWKYPSEGSARAGTAVKQVAIDDGRLHLTTRGGVYSIDKETGRAMWAYNAGANVTVLEGDTLYVWGHDGHLAALRVKTP